MDDISHEKHFEFIHNEYMISFNLFISVFEFQHEVGNSSYEIELMPDLTKSIKVSNVDL
jgi:hypothetical protein